MSDSQKKKALIILGLIIIIITMGAILFLPKGDRQKVAEVSLPMCQTDSFKCSWNEVTGASSYKFTITDVSTNTVVKSGNIPSGRKLTVAYTPVRGKNYRCDVVAINACGNSDTASATSSCSK